MKKWIITPDNQVINVDAIELISPNPNGGAVIHLPGGRSFSVKQSPKVLLSEIKETGDSVYSLP